MICVALSLGDGDGGAAHFVDNDDDAPARGIEGLLDGVDRASRYAPSGACRVLSEPQLSSMMAPKAATRARKAYRREWPKIKLNQALLCVCDTMQRGQPAAAAATHQINEPPQPRACARARAHYFEKFITTKPQRRRRRQIHRRCFRRARTREAIIDFRAATKWLDRMRSNCVCACACVRACAPARAAQIGPTSCCGVVCCARTDCFLATSARCLANTRRCCSPTRSANTAT